MDKRKQLNSGKVQWIKIMSDHHFKQEEVNRGWKGSCSLTERVLVTSPVENAGWILHVCFTHEVKAITL